jgi:hypothetical protein
MRDPATGEYSGAVPDMLKEIARQLGVPYRLIPGENAKAVMDAVNGHTADIGFLAYDEHNRQDRDYVRGAGNERARSHSSLVLSRRQLWAGIRLSQGEGRSIGADQHPTRTIYAGESGGKHGCFGCFPFGNVAER